MDLALLTVVLVRVFLVVTMLSIGLRLVDDRPVTVRRDARLIAGLLVGNLLLVPAVGVGIAALAGLGGAVAIAFMAVVVAPAGSLAPKLVQVARGDLPVGVAATFGLSVIATVTVAPSLAIGEQLLGMDAATSPIDPMSVIASLAIFQLVPMLLGLVLAHRAPAPAGRVVGPLTAASTVLIAVIVAVAVADTADELTGLGVMPVIAMAAIVLAAGAIGWITGGSEDGVRRASLIVTAQRSPGLALLVVAGPGHAVETATVATFALVLLVVNSVIALGLHRGWSTARVVRRDRLGPVSGSSVSAERARDGVDA